MANDKISNMTAAAVAALTGTGAAVEVSTGIGGVPATKQGLLRDLRTAMFAGGTGYTAADPLVVGNLSASGTSTLTGNVGIGVAPDASMVAYLGGANVVTSGTAQRGLFVNARYSSAATTSGTAVYAGVVTQAASFTMTSAFGVYVEDATKGAGSSITTNYGIFINAQTAGTTNYAIYSAGGLNYFAGNTSFYDYVTLGTNNKGLYGVTTGAAAKSLLLLDSSDQMALGSPGVPIILYFYDGVAGSNKAGLVTVGASDSGGTGYRLLRIPN